MRTTLLGGGGPVTTLASGLSQPSSLVVDADCVYWVSYGSGKVMKVAKP